MKKIFNIIAICFLILTLSSFSAGGAIRVYLMAGQSNMDGVADPNDPNVPEELRKPQTNVKIYHVAAPGKLSSWKNLRLGCSSTGKTFGPELSFGQAMGEALPNDEIMIIKYAFGGTDIYSHWNVDGKQLYPDFIEKTKHALSLIDAPYEIAGMCWQQGEKDSRDDAEHKAKAYEKNLSDFIKCVRKDFNASEMKFVLGYVSDLKDVDFSPKHNFPYTDVVQKAQLKVSQTLPNVFLVEESKNKLTFNEDKKHYDALGQMKLGRLYAQEMLKDSKRKCSILGF